MKISREVVVYVLLIALIKSSNSRKPNGRKHDARIMTRPDDVPVVKCGDEIKLTCMAEGDPKPEIEWWFYNQRRSDTPTKTIVRQADREGRVKVKIEEFYVVRSTLFVRDAEEYDEGIYQCRASNSRLRKAEKINLYQHWRVEQAPVGKVMCEDAVTSQTQVFSASEYNQTVIDDVIARAVTTGVAETMTSGRILFDDVNRTVTSPAVGNLTSSTHKPTWSITTEAATTEPESSSTAETARTSTKDAMMSSTDESVTSSTTTTTTTSTTTKKMRKHKAKMRKVDVNEDIFESLPKDHKKRVTSPTMTKGMTKQSKKRKEQKAIKKEIYEEKLNAVEDPKEMIKKYVQSSPGVVTTTVPQNVVARLNSSATATSSTEGNSGQPIFNRSWLLAILHVPLTAFLIMTSSR